MNENDYRVHHHQTMTTPIGSQEWTIVYNIFYGTDERGEYADIEIVTLKNPDGKQIEEISGLMLSSLREDVANMYDLERWGPR